ncbi:hypothetical protein HY772_06050 [Candidatus Woesearchaeota archaeon]|nr:hypothetical protein [Candidatus Woesearchaeota archaeon]
MNAQNKKQNKNMLRGLPAILFASAVASCTREKPVDLYALKCPAETAEKIVISVNYKDKEIDCHTADVDMDQDGYTISCDKNHYFNYDGYVDELKWGKRTYYDGDRDGRVDMINTQGLGNKFRMPQPKTYDEKLLILRKNEINQRWELCWKQQ